MLPTGTKLPFLPVLSMSLRVAAVGLILLAVADAPVWAAKKGQVEFRVVDSKSGEPIAVRMHLTDQKQKVVKPPKSVFWHDHFVFDGSIKLELAPGNYAFEMERGPEYKIRTGYFTIEDNASDVKELTMERFLDMTDEGWYSGDLAVMRPASDMEVLLKAEDLRVAPVVAWTGKATAKSIAAEPVSCDGGKRWYQLSAGRDDRDAAALLLFGLETPLGLAAAVKEAPSSVAFAAEAHETRGSFVVAERPTAWDLPALVAAGQLDAVLLAHPGLERDGTPVKDPPGKPRENVRYPNPQGLGRWSQDVYYQLLNAGLRLPPAAGSGSGYAPNPVGYNRVYVHVEGEFTWDKWWQGLRAGRVVVTNGPVMQPTVDGHLPGHVFQAGQGETLELSIALNLSTREKIEYMEVIKDGRSVHEVRLDKWAEANGKLPPVRFTESGWMLVRAVTANEKTYRYATSGPFYVEIGYQPRISKKAAQFFADWTLERAKQIKLEPGEQRDAVMQYHRAARDFWESKLEKANAE
jgi:hypothetical protein